MRLRRDAMAAVDDQPPVRITLRAFPVLRHTVRACVAVVSIAAAPAASPAQTVFLDLPLQSQRAEVSQTVGLTDIRIQYHRPLVNGRTIWGDVVPYDSVWRAGANINTTISFSTPVTVEGKPIAEGTYGLHMIPHHDAWTIIFSKNSTSWGSFTYDSSEDALRVSVTPRPGPMHEALTYEFGQVQAASAVVLLEWEKLAVPFTVGVNVHAVVLASMRKQLRTLARYNWQSWEECAAYLLAEHVDLDTALVYANQSITYEDRFGNELTKSKVLAALGRQDEATATEEKALARATPIQADYIGRQRLAAKHTEGALAVFHANAVHHPELWFVHDGMARGYSAQGKFAEAGKEMRAAIASAPVEQKSTLEALLKRLESKQDINQ